jgi:oligopeptide transport system substrate-binding protein
VSLAVSSFAGLALALGVVWTLLFQPAAQARIIDPARETNLDPGTPDTVQAQDISADGIEEPHITLEKNDDYYEAASVAITRATSLFIDSDEAWTRYQSGEFDTIAPPADALETIKGSTVYSPQLHAYPRQCTYYYGFSHDVPPFDDPLVRAAFASAIDRPRLIQEVESLTGDEFPAVTFTPPGSFGHVDGYAEGIGRPYSPTLAQDLLAASGYTGTPTITLMFNTSSFHEPIAEAVRQMWIDTLGITVTLQDMEWGSYWDLLSNGSVAERPGVWRLGWCAAYPDANYFLSIFSGWHRSRYDNPAYDALVQAAARETDPAERLALYEQAEATLVMTDTAIIPLYTYVNHRLARPDLDRTYRPFGAQHLDEWTFSGDLRPLAVARSAPDSLDPALATDWSTVEQLFLGLTDIDEDGTPVPELATDWDASADATVYTFTMRGDVSWTDGSPVTAQDVEYGVLRSLDPDTRSGSAYRLYIIENAREYNQGGISDPDLVGVEALDAAHVRFTLSASAAHFPIIAGLPPARPQPQSAIETHGCAWTAPEHIVTNGPYELVAWEGPSHLSINTYADDAPVAGEVLVLHIAYQNTGGSPAADTVISDTLLGGLSYISDTASVAHSGSGTPGDPLVWDLGSVPAHTCGSFAVHARVGAFPHSQVTSQAQIATSSPDDLGSPSERESEWSRRVEGPAMVVNYGANRASGVYEVGHTIQLTVTDDVGALKATATVETEQGGSMHDGWWQDGFVADGDDWSTAPLDIQPGDTVHFRSDEGYINSIQVGTITGQLDTAADTVAGTVTAPWFAGQTLQADAGAWGFTFRDFTLQLDMSGADDYFVDFTPDDLLPDQSIDVFYTQPDGDRVGNVLQAMDLSLNVNYGDDWVEGTYETGHTVWITVTNSTGTQVKGTAVLTTGMVPWWDGRTGFSTNWHGWATDRPDIEPGDRVRGQVDSGYASTVRIGTITGEPSASADAIAGTVHASWFTQILNGRCGVWAQNGPWHDFTVAPDGGSYACDFGAMGWDLLPDHNVAVQYQEPDGDWVINAFRTPWQVYLPLTTRNH